MQFDPHLGLGERQRRLQFTCFELFMKDEICFRPNGSGQFLYVTLFVPFILTANCHEVASNGLDFN
jgi:hypothetical protein